MLSPTNRMRELKKVIRLHISIKHLHRLRRVRQQEHRYLAKIKLNAAFILLNGVDEVCKLLKKISGKMNSRQCSVHLDIVRCM